jgi:hypothetical protein
VLAVALALGALLGIALVAADAITRGRPVPPVPPRAMRALLEREGPNDGDGTP